MRLSKGSREDAIHALINLWLKDDRVSCMYCSRDSFYEDCPTCNGQPLLANNKETLKVFSAEMKNLRETRMNKHASTRDRSMRMSLSIPVSLYTFLNKAMNAMYHEDLITKDYDINWFMKRFGKYFQVPEER